MARLKRNTPETDLIRYFKYLVTIVVGAITIVATAVAYFTYHSYKDLRQELKEEQQFARERLKEIEEDYKASKGQYKDEWNNLKESAELTVNETKEQANDKIGQVAYESQIIAQLQAKEKINEVFQNKNFDQFVVSIAEERIKPKVNELVDSRMQKLNRERFDQYVEGLFSDDLNTYAISYTNVYINISHYELTQEQIDKLVIEAEKPYNFKSETILQVLILSKNQKAIDGLKKLYFYDSRYQDILHRHYTNSNYTIVEYEQLFKYAVDNKYSIDVEYYELVTNACDENTKLAVDLLNSEYLKKALQRELGSKFPDYVEGLKNMARHRIFDVQLEQLRLFQ